MASSQENPVVYSASGKNDYVRTMSPSKKIAGNNRTLPVQKNLNSNTNTNVISHTNDTEIPSIQFDRTLYGPNTSTTASVLSKAKPKGKAKPKAKSQPKSKPKPMKTKTTKVKVAKAKIIMKSTQGKVNSNPPTFVPSKLPWPVLPPASTKVVANTIKILPTKSSPTKSTNKLSKSRPSSAKSAKSKSVKAKSAKEKPTTLSKKKDKAKSKSSPQKKSPKKVSKVPKIKIKSNNQGKGKGTLENKASPASTSSSPSSLGNLKKNLMSSIDKLNTKSSSTDNSQTPFDILLARAKSGKCDYPAPPILRLEFPIGSNGSRMFSETLTWDLCDPDIPSIKEFAESLKRDFGISQHAMALIILQMQSQVEKYKNNPTEVSNHQNHIKLHPHGSISSTTSRLAQEKLANLKTSIEKRHLSNISSKFQAITSSSTPISFTGPTTSTSLELTEKSSGTATAAAMSLKVNFKKNQSLSSSSNSSSSTKESKTTLSTPVSSSSSTVASTITTSTTKSNLSSSASSSSSASKSGSNNPSSMRVEIRRMANKIRSEMEKRIVAEQGQIVQKAYCHVCHVTHREAFVCCNQKDHSYCKKQLWNRLKISFLETKKLQCAVCMMTCTCKQCRNIVETRAMDVIENFNGEIQDIHLIPPKDMQNFHKKKKGATNIKASPPPMDSTTSSIASISPKTSPLQNEDLPTSPFPFSFTSESTNTSSDNMLISTADSSSASNIPSPKDSPIKKTPSLSTQSSPGSSTKSSRSPSPKKKVTPRMALKKRKLTPMNRSVTNSVHSSPSGGSKNPMSKIYSTNMTFLDPLHSLHKGKCKDMEQKAQFIRDHMEFCCFCKRLESSTVQLAQCATCPRAYHVSCISKAFSISRLPTCLKDMNWTCEPCQKQVDTRIELKWTSEEERRIQIDKLWLCQKLLQYLMKHDYAIGFLTPFHSEFLTQTRYKDHISLPMDFQTLQSKILKRNYISILQFVYDLNRIWYNCRQWNERGSAIVQMANTLESIAYKLIHYFKPFLVSEEYQKISQFQQQNQLK